MSKPVDMQVLAKTVAEYGFAYLVTIADGDRIHTSPVKPALSADRLVVPAPSSRVQKNTSQRPKVSLVWPPAQPDGYSLIVDGAAQFDGDVLAVIPSRAILHRPEVLTPPDGDSCVADCIEI
ncbi:hypothetical protein [Parafrigoribacterium soli]|uniref:hypothetical protein n=1 Tax=Parafrigoribacterium soli TaxID=3144663 RepID=UPI0032EBF098